MSFFENFFSRPIASRISLSLRAVDSCVASAYAFLPASGSVSASVSAFCTSTFFTYCMVMVLAPDSTPPPMTFWASARNVDCTSTPPCS